MDQDFFNRLQKEKEYKAYLMFHISHVEEAYHRLIEPLKGRYDNSVDGAISLCGMYIPLHDLSKLSKEEFDVYRLHFYPTKNEKQENRDDKDAWNKAKEHHYAVNPHHCYYWVKNGESTDIPLNFIFEMLCDWSAVSKWYDSSVVDWYDKEASKEKATFSKHTRELVDHWVDEIFRIPNIKY